MAPELHVVISVTTRASRELRCRIATFLCRSFSDAVKAVGAYPGSHTSVRTTYVCSRGACIQLRRRSYGAQVDPQLAPVCVGHVTMIAINPIVALVLVIGSRQSYRDVKSSFNVA